MVGMGCFGWVRAGLRAVPVGSVGGLFDRGHGFAAQDYPGAYRVVVGLVDGHAFHAYAHERDAAAAVFVIAWWWPPAAVVTHDDHHLALPARCWLNLPPDVH